MAGLGGGAGEKAGDPAEEGLIDNMDESDSKRLKPGCIAVNISLAR